VLITKTIIMKWNIKNKKWYESKGYKFTKYNDEFKVNAEDLSISSKHKIKVICDYCGQEIEKTYQDYLNGRKIIKKDACKQCQGLKLKESNLLIYGVESVSKLDEYKEKIKQNNRKKYNIDWHTQSDNFKNKTKETIQRKFGVDYYSQTDEYRQKFEETSLKNWGTSHPFLSEEIQLKKTNTLIKNYGVVNPMFSEEIKKNLEKSNLNKYGTKSPMQNKQVQEKRNRTNLLKYGSISPGANKNVQIKMKNTNLKKYGTEYVINSKEVREKIAQSFYKNGTIPTSSQQTEIYNLLKENKYNIELNYPLSNVNLDVAIFINDIKIDLEYDAWYWHQNKQKDRRRDEFVKSQGWKILRIRSGHKMPTLSQIEESIDKLINTDRTFTQIILDDWKIDNKEVII